MPSDRRNELVVRYCLGKEQSYSMLCWQWSSKIDRHLVARSVFGSNRAPASCMQGRRPNISTHSRLFWCCKRNIPPGHFRHIQLSRHQLFLVPNQAASAHSYSRSYNLLQRYAAKPPQFRMQYCCELLTSQVDNNPQR